MKGIFEGKTEQEAVERAAKEFGVSKEFMDIEVIRRKGGIFGLSNKVTIKVTVEGIPTEREEQIETHRRPPKEPVKATSYETTEEVRERIRNIVRDFITKMGIMPKEIRCEKDSPYVEVVVEEYKEQSLLIGRFGKNIEALQILVNAIIQSKIENAPHVVLDVEGYRKKRDDWMRTVAEKRAEQVIRTRKSFLMEEFGPYDRKQIHTAIQSIDGVQTESIGTGYFKRVKIFLE